MSNTLDATSFLLLIFYILLTTETDYKVAEEWNTLDVRVSRNSTH